VSTRREFITLLGGAAAAWPLAARAQQQPTPVIGFMSSRERIGSTAFVGAFQRGLNESGFVEGRNVVIDYRWAEGEYNRLPEMAADLVRRDVNVVVSVGGDPAIQAAKAAIVKIPIVFVTGRDPIKAGLVNSLNRPEGNITGIHAFLDDIGAKRLGLLREIIPNVRLIAMLLNPNSTVVETVLGDVQEAARSLGVQVRVLRASTEGEIDNAFANLIQAGAEAVINGADPYFTSRREQIVKLAARYRIPAIYELREYTMAGGLMSYGTSLTEGYRQAGVYAGKILKGAKPAELPIVQSTKFELVINLKTANTLGLMIPPGVLAIADEVVE
jgi:putative ABC transport system substrate-binding protein